MYMWPGLLWTLSDNTFANGTTRGKINAGTIGNSIYNVGHIRNVSRSDINAFLQGEFFLQKGVAWQEAWDVEADEKFELK